MVNGHATTTATQTFAASHHTSEDFYQNVLDLTLSSIGIGSFAPEPYKEENYLYSFTDSTIKAVELGCNVIDTAINYRCQESEKEIGKAILALQQAGISRESLFISSKAGFIPLDFPFPENPYEWIEANILTPKRATKEEIIVDQHCLAPDYIRWSCEQSLRNLGLETLDVFYLHNPEFQLGYLPREELIQRLQTAFKTCEALADEGKIRAYGIASWNGFLYEPEHTEFLNLQQVFDAAREAVGVENRFLFLQVPYNLAKPHPYSYTNQQMEDGLFYTFFQAAKKLGFQITTSSSLLRMNLFKRPFNQTVGSLLGEFEMSDLHRALQFARSAPQVDCALFSSKNPEHMEHNLMMTQFPQARLDHYQQIFKA